MNLGRYNTTQFPGNPKRLPTEMEGFLFFKLQIQKFGIADMDQRKSEKIKEN